MSKHKSVKGKNTDSFEESAANAKLIAAAPELLEALKNLLSEFTTIAPDLIMRRIRKEQAEQAITKAEA